MKTVNLAELAEKLKNFSQYKDVKGLQKFSEKCVQIGNRLEAPLTIMVMGEFSTGKSTLINAIVGEEIAAVNATPTTAVITVLTYGEKEKVVVHYKNGYENEFDAKNFAKLTAMSANSKFNNLHSTIKYVERFMPLDILKDVAVIDSPGLNDTDEGHIAATEEFMDNADVVLWVSSVEQAGKRSEIDSMKMLSSRLKPVLVVNKIDMVDEEEEDPKEILSRLENQLGNRVQSVIGVSAKMALHGKLNNDEAKLEASNFNELTFYIQMFVLPNRYQIKLNSFFDELGTLFYYEIGHIRDNLIPYYEAGVKVDVKYSSLLETFKNWRKDLENLVLMVNNDMEEFIKQGNASALFFKGILFDMGVTVIESKNQAEQYLQQAQELNHLMATIELGGVYYNLEKDDFVIDTLKDLADAGNCDAQIWCGLAYSRKGEKDVGLKYLQLAVKTDERGIANKNLGCRYLNKENRSEEDEKKAVACFESSVALGCPWAKSWLGLCYRDGFGVEQDYKKALSLFFEGVEDGYTSGLCSLAFMYYYGLGTDVDKDKALYWFKIASELNDNDSTVYFWLGHLYLDEDVDEHDEDEAFKYFAKAVDLGNAEAQNMLGRCYTEGWGVEKNPYKAFEWFKQSAENGNEDARNNLALCYMSGDGVVQNWNYGYSMLQQSAQQGNEAAQNLIREIDANNNSSNEYEDNQDEDDDHTLSGAAIGAGIGTFLGGPLGTVIGGAIGGWLGGSDKEKK